MAEFTKKQREMLELLAAEGQVTVSDMAFMLRTNRSGCMRIYYNLKRKRGVPMLCYKDATFPYGKVLLWATDYTRENFMPDEDEDDP